MEELGWEGGEGREGIEGGREGGREERLLFASYVDTRMVRLRMWVSLCNDSK